MTPLELWQDGYDAGRYGNAGPDPEQMSEADRWDWMFGYRRGLEAGAACRRNLLTAMPSR